MKLTYIYHSCFIIEDGDTALVFDYYKNGGLLADVFNKIKSIYVFASHNHADHYNPEILAWESRYPAAAFHYILSSDIPGKTNAAYITAGENYKNGAIKARAYASTDCGVSFVVNFGGKTIFHAGDLNNWHWNEEVSAEESKGYEDAYLDILNDIAKDYPHIDIVMFPVDPRLGRDYYKGAAQFISKIQTTLFAPMHFNDNYKKANVFKGICETYNTGFFCISKPGDSIILGG